MCDVKSLGVSSAIVLSVLLSAITSASSPVYDPESTGQSYSMELRTLPKDVHFSMFKQQGAFERGAPSLSIQNKQKTFYYGSFQIGSGGETFTGVMDTGSSDIWIPNKSCQSKGCQGKHTFNTASSSTFKSTGKSISIMYGTGSMNGTEGLDSITLAGLTVEQQGFAVADYVADFFAQMPFDGVFGLGYKALSEDNIPTWFQNAAKDGTIPVEQFSFYLSNNADSSDSRMIIGEYDKSYFKGDISWNPLEAITRRETKELYYNIRVKGASIAGKPLNSNCGDQGCPAIVDSGTSYLMVPMELYEQVIDTISVKPDCSNLDEVPSFEITIGDNHYEVPAKYLVVKLEDESGKTACKLAVGMSWSPLIGWVLGDTFMRSKYSIFDQKNARVGFAELADELQADDGVDGLKTIYVESVEKSLLSR